MLKIKNLLLYKSGFQFRRFMNSKTLENTDLIDKLDILIVHWIDVETMFSIVYILNCILCLANVNKLIR